MTEDPNIPGSEPEEEQPENQIRDQLPDENLERSLFRTNFEGETPAPNQPEMSAQPEQQTQASKLQDEESQNIQEVPFREDSSRPIRNLPHQPVPETFSPGHSSSPGIQDNPAPAQQKASGIGIRQSPGLNKGRNCRRCNTPFQPDDRFCSNCGCPGYQDPAFLKRYLRRVYQLRQKQQNNDSIVLAGRIALFFLAGFTLISGFLLRAYFSAPQLDIFIVLTGLVYASIGLWSRWEPLAGLLAGLLLYVTLQLIQGATFPSTISRGIVIKVLVLIVLVRGVIAGIHNQQIKFKLGPGEPEQKGTRS